MIARAKSNRNCLLSCFLSVCFILIVFSLKAQEQKSNYSEAFINALEFLENDDVSGIEILVDQLYGYERKPLNLNSASREELSQFPLLNSFQIEQFIAYRSTNGNIENWNELMKISGFDFEVVSTIRPFASLEGSQTEVGNWLADWIEGKWELANAYQFSTQKEGFKSQSDSVPAVYSGDNFRYYHRVRKRLPGKYSFGWIAEQDAGEPKNSVFNFDFNTFHFFIQQKKKIIRKVALGDYQMQVGQNLVIAPSFALSKSLNILSVKQGGNQLYPNTSVNENLFYRGAAVEVGGEQHQITGFYSSNKVDGTLTSESFTLRSSGLHRTESEQLGKDVLRAKSGGFFSNHYFGKWKLGTSVLGYRFETANGEIKFDDQVKVGLNYQYAFGNGIFFGETGWDKNNQSWATINGMLVALGRKTNFGLTHRYYSPDYDNYFANAIRNSTKTQNEHGVLTGVTVNPFYGLKIGFFVDHYENFAAVYNRYSPASATDALAEVKLIKKRKWEVYARYRYRVRQEEVVASSELTPSLSDDAKQSFRIQSSFNVGSGFTFRTRWEQTFTSNESGTLVYQDVIWKPLTFPLSFTARLALFNTPTFNERIYAFENNLPYTFSIPAYYNKGSRKYIQVRYKTKLGIDLWLRYGVWKYKNLYEIGSGNDAILGSKKEELQVMVRYQF